MNTILSYKELSLVNNIINNYLIFYKTIYDQINYKHFIGPVQMKYCIESLLQQYDLYSISLFNDIQPYLLSSLSINIDDELYVVESNIVYKFLCKLQIVPLIYIINNIHITKYI